MSTEETIKENVLSLGQAMASNEEEQGFLAFTTLLEIALLDLHRLANAAENVLKAIMEDVVSKFEGALPRHNCELRITHNAHRNCYEKLEQYLIDNGLANEPRAKECISTDSLWELYWYPDTPVGSYVVIGPTLESVIRAAQALK